MTKIKVYARRKAREFALQGLYQWIVTKHELPYIEAQFMAEKKIKKTDVTYFQELLHEIPKNISHIDSIFSPLLDREIGQINPVELTILRMGTYELLYRLDIPAPIVINEAVELGKTFGADGSFKYINGVLDKLSKKVRQSEKRNRAGT